MTALIRKGVHVGAEAIPRVTTRAEMLVAGLLAVGELVGGLLLGALILPVVGYAILRGR